MRDGRPDPDPSVLTTSNLQREVASLKELIFVRLDAMDRAIKVASDELKVVPTATDRAVQNLRDLHETRFQCLSEEVTLAREVIQTRFEGMDRALNLLQAIADRFPERIDEKIASLKELHDGQFRAIQGQFAERDVRSDKMSEASALAIGAALQAAKEAVAEQARSAALATAKSETAQMKAIEQMQALIQSMAAATDGKITDIKDRLVRIEGASLGSAEARGQQHSGSTLTVSMVAVGLSFLALIATVAFHFVK